MRLQIYPELNEQLYREVLPNGLTVCIVLRPGFSRKIAYFVTDYGSIHTSFTAGGKQLRSPEGVAHYLEHKLFDMPGRDITEEFAALGANPNAFTSYDMTAYYFSCTENFYQSLGLLLEFVTTPYFTEESVRKEQEIIGQEIDMNEDSADARITPEILSFCHSAFYHPENMLLCVVGDVEPEQIRQLALQILPEPAGARGEKIPLPQEEMTCPMPLVTAHMEVAMPMFQLGFKSQPLGLGEAAVRRELIGDLAAEALFGESSQLYLRLYEEGMIDSSFGGGFETVEGMSMLTASGDSNAPEAVRDAILEQAAVLLRQGIPEADFLRMKRSALGRRIRDLDSFDSTCFRVCAYHFSGFDYFRFPEIYRDVEVSEVLNFIQQTVIPERCSLSVVYPNEQEESK